MTHLDICKKCFQNQTSCCTLKPDNPEKMMIPPVSVPEISRILAHINGTRIDDIVSPKPNSAFYAKQMVNLFPDMKDDIYDRFPIDNYHYELKTNGNSCALLGKQGCMLPKDLRPHFCRIYPFWFFDEEPLLFQDSECLALKSCNTMTEAFLALGTTPDQLKQIHNQICQDWDLQPALVPAEVSMSY